MKRLLLALVLIISSALPANADVWIPKKYRVPNRDPGYCAWCCLETMGRNQKIEKLYNLADNRANDPPEWVWDKYKRDWMLVQPHLGPLPAVKQKLKNLKVKFSAIDDTTNTKFLKEAANKYGCVVCIIGGGPENLNGIWKGDHAVLLTEYTDDKVEFINPNDREYYKASREWFDYWWSGYAVTVEK